MKKSNFYERKKLELYMLFIALFLAVISYYTLDNPVLERDELVEKVVATPPNLYYDNSEKAIWYALYANDTKALIVALDKRYDYFSEDDEKIAYSKVGEAFKNGVISLESVKIMHHYGLDLNDLKAVELSWEMYRFLKDRNIDPEDKDIRAFSPQLQEAIKDADMDLMYYRYKRSDDYYLSQLAKKLPAKSVLETLFYLLENGYHPKPLVLGYVMAALLNRETISITPQVVQKFKALGLKLVERHEPAVYPDTESYLVLQALTYHHLNNIPLIQALQDTGLDVNALDYFNYHIIYHLCSHLSDTQFTEKKKGIQYLLDAELILAHKDLESCSRDEIKQLLEMDRGTYKENLMWYQNQTEPSLSYQINQLLYNPIILSILFLVVAPLFVLFIVIGIIVLIYKNRKKYTKS